MTDTIKQRIQEEMKDAMRAKDKPRLSAIRLILAAFKQREVDERIEVDDSLAIDILSKMKKQRQESVKQYTAGGRDDLAAQESAEIVLIQTYLPTPLSDDDIETLIKDTIASTGATQMKDMGKVMATLKPLVQGRADMNALSQKIKNQLT